MLLILLVTTTVFVYCYYKYYWLKYWIRRGVPGPKPSLIFGNIKENFFLKKNLGEIITDIYYQYPNAPLVGIFKASTPTVIIRDPELVKEVTVKSFTHFHDNDFYVDDNKDPLFARNPFVAPGAVWKKHRASLIPCFSNAKVRILYDLLDESCVKFVKHIDSQKEAFSGDGIEAKNLMSRFTLNNVGTCAFGIDPKVYEDPNCEFAQIANSFLSPTGWSSIQLFISTLIPAVNKIFAIRFTPVDVQKKIRSMVMDAIKYREQNNIVRNDFLEIMNNLRKDNNSFFSDIDVAAHAAGFFVDGYQTSSLVMSFLFYEIARNPDVQTRLREEINTTLEENNGKLTYELLQQMPYLDAVFNESLRLHPPLFTFSRVCTKDYTYVPKEGDGLSKNVTIEAGTPTLIPVHALHHDPKYFEDPDSFRPERFLGENKDKIVKYTFMPFGEGPRICLGQRFGWFQVKMGIFHLIKNFEVSVNPKTKVPLRYDPVYFLVFPSGGLWIDFKRIPH